jgi:hypothetical protein
MDIVGEKARGGYGLGSTKLARDGVLERRL